MHLKDHNTKDMPGFFKKLFSKRETERKPEPGTGASGLSTQAKTIVWMGHGMPSDLEIMPMLDRFERAVKAGDKETTIAIYNEFQDKVKAKSGPFDVGMDVFKRCCLSKDLLDVYKLVLEDHRDEDVLSGKGAIRRILKYSIELGTPDTILNTLTGFFVDNAWFDDMPEQEEWLKLALECMMVTGNGELGRKVLERLEAAGGLSEEDMEELSDHARESLRRVDCSWM